MRVGKLLLKHFFKYDNLNTKRLVLHKHGGYCKMRRYIGGALMLLLFAGLISCGKQEEKKEAGKIEEKKEIKVGEETKLPEGHPPVGNSGKDTISGDIGTKGVGDVNKSAVGHPSSGEVKREVRVPDEVKAKWKTVNLKLVDKEKKKEEIIIVTVGKEAPIKGTKLAIKAEVFLPHYTMYDTYISSKSNEPVNPAVLVELLENGKSITKGWVFTNFTAFNSYKHARYEILLPPISLK